MPNKSLILFCGIIVCLLIFIIIDELFIVFRDYLTYTIITMYAFGLTMPIYMGKSKGERRRLIIISSLIFTLSMLLVVSFLQIARGMSFEWAFFKIVVIIIGLSALHLKIALMSIQKSSENPECVLRKKPTDSQSQ